MPYTMCPLCGSLMHVSVVDHKQWYDERGVPFGSLVPLRCFYCWKEIGVGDVVVIRHLITPKEGVREGDRGTVKAILASPDGALTEVGMANGKNYYFVRAEVRPLIGSEAENAGGDEEKK